MVPYWTAWYYPLGLGSKGPNVDFQVKARPCLYRTLFMTGLARRYTP